MGKQGYPVPVCLLVWHGSVHSHKYKGQQRAYQQNTNADERADVIVQLWDVCNDQIRKFVAKDKQYQTDNDNNYKCNCIENREQTDFKIIVLLFDIV